MKWWEHTIEGLTLVLIITLLFSNSLYSKIESNIQGTNLMNVSATIFRTSDNNNNVTRIWLVDDNGPADFSTIQDAVNEVNEGDIIIVRAGIYIENVKVNKNHLIIKSESGADVTIVQAINQADNVFEVTADHVTINGFTVKLASISENINGIYLNGANHCKISHNSVSENINGIYLQGPSNENVISDNTIYNSNQYGIRVKGVPNAGPWMVPDEESSINNLVYNNIIHNCYMGIDLYLANKNIIAKNKVYNTQIGIYIDCSHDNIIQNNKVSSNAKGINFHIAANNILTTNTCKNNAYGMGFQDTTRNVIYLNSFIDNTNSISVFITGSEFSKPYPKTFDSLNIWNTQKELTYTYNAQIYTNYLGNYWSDYDPSGNESIGGISNTSYEIYVDNFDYYPLLNPWAEYKLMNPEAAFKPIPPISELDDITPPSLSTAPDNMTEEWTDCVIQWFIEDRHPCTYAIYIDSTIVDYGTWTNGIFSWHVNNLVAGTYNVTLVVWDLAFHSVSDTVWITITPDTTPPTCILSSEITFDSEETTQSINWTVGDRHPGIYTIYSNSTLVDSGTWTNGTISWDFNGYTPGTYNITLIICDLSNNCASDIIWVPITTAADTIPPSLSKPANFSYVEGTRDIISWEVSDGNPATYELYIDSILMDFGSWTNGSITWSVTGLQAGTYNATLVVWDAAENRATNTVWVTITTLHASSTKPRPYFVSSLTGIEILAALTAIIMWRKKK